MIIRFFPFSLYHGKPDSGSTYLRVRQVIKYWDEAEEYKYGENPDVLIFQKVYCTQDYKFPLHFEGLKILDICDPDWMEGQLIKETVDAVDAVTCPTENLAQFLSQLTDKPIMIIPDRFDLELIPKPKQHKEKAKSVVWFGYRHNSELLKPAIHSIIKHKLKLILISEDDPLFGHAYHNLDYEFVKYSEETAYLDLQRGDFAVLPNGFRPQDRFKSNNKTIKSNLAGLPVATNIDEVSFYTEPKNRREWFDKNYVKIREDYDVKLSVKQYKELISQLQSSS